MGIGDRPRFGVGTVPRKMPVELGTGPKGIGGQALVGILVGIGDRPQNCGVAA